MAEPKIATVDEEGVKVIVRENDEIWVIHEYAESRREPKGWGLALDLDRANALRDALNQVLEQGEG